MRDLHAKPQIFLARGHYQKDSTLADQVPMIITMKQILILAVMMGTLSFMAGMYYQSQRPVSLQTVARLAKTVRGGPGTQTVCEAIAYDAVLWHMLNNHEQDTDQDATMAHSRCGQKRLNYVPWEH